MLYQKSPKSNSFQPILVILRYKITRSAFCIETTDNVMLIRWQTGEIFA